MKLFQLIQLFIQLHQEFERSDKENTKYTHLDRDDSIVYISIVPKKWK